MYDNFFPIKKIKLKSKDLKNPWITLGIKRSPKCKLRLCNTFLNNGTPKNGWDYKYSKTLFETIKKRSKNFTFLI